MSETRETLDGKVGTKIPYKKKDPFIFIITT